MREWKRILFDSRMATMMLVVPFIYALIFGSVYREGIVKHVPIVIVDADHSHLSREITTALAASEKLTIYAQANSPQDFLPMVRQDKAFACVVMPENFERDMLAGRKASVAIIADGSNLLVGNVAAGAIGAVLTTYRVGINAEELSYAGVASTAAMSAAMPIQPSLRLPFNPTSSYRTYILMGLLVIVVQQVLRMGSGISLLLDGVDELWEGLDDPVPSVRTVLLAKLGATMMLAIPTAFLAVGAPFLVYRAPFRGSILILLLVLPIYMIMQICIGYGYSIFFRSPVTSTQFHMFMSANLFMLSGVTWPYYAMPHWLRPIAYCTPAFHMNSIVRKIALDGAGPGLLLNHLIALLIMLAIAVPWAYCAVWRQLKRTGRMETSYGHGTASQYLVRL
jgi:ABC-2 type transport system permease protein